MMNFQSTAESGQITFIILPRNILRNHIFIETPISANRFPRELPKRKQAGII
jgi:hypothetical protein